MIVDQHLQRRQSLYEDGTPQILLITPSEKNLGHHLTLSIDTFNYEKNHVSSSVKFCPSIFCNIIMIK